MSNPEGKTGRRSVRYVRPGLTQVIYEDRILDIRTQGETKEEFASKVKARTGKVPAGYKTKEQAYKDRRAKSKEAGERAKAKARAQAKAKKEKAKARAATKKAKTSTRKAAKPKKISALEEGLASGKYVLE